MPPPPPYTPIPSGPPPLWAPFYGASFGAAIARFWRKYATFSGRASRSEYWWWYLAYFIFVVVLEIIFAAFGSTSMVTISPTAAPVLGTGYYVISGILSVIELALLIPSLAIFWRRMHDTNRSGGWFFIGLIPLVGGIILLVFLVSGPNPAGARFDRPQS
ncbi:MAG TPA: DUF805 domain-containing protein [Galbitalea sp.]|jgi:uncharacterized membrane protein YhaH (DUF805 family)|nr:DUF805 domain-containing protein [Galbitalea sp.]